jgi:class 3 adenylate cyclase
MIKTVLIVDLVGYSAVARGLEQSGSAQSVASLNEQIQGFIDEGLTAAAATREQNVTKTTGDGAILVFDQADQAHRCAVQIHRATARHNEHKADPLEYRYFRIGAASGDVTSTADSGGREDVAGVTIARAERLQTAAYSGEIVADKPTYAQLSEEHKKSYGEREKVRGKRNEEFFAHRCPVIHDVDEEFERLVAAESNWAALIRRHPRWAVAALAAAIALVFWAGSLVLGKPPPVFPGGEVMNAFQAREALKGEQDRVPGYLAMQEQALLGMEALTEVLRATREENILKQLKKTQDYFQERASDAAASEARRPLDEFLKGIRSFVDNREDARVYVFRSDPLPGGLRTTLRCETFAKVDQQINVLAFINRVRRAEVRTIDHRSNQNEFTLELKDIEQDDELWVIVGAHSKRDLPGENTYAFKEVGR